MTLEVLACREALALELGLSLDRVAIPYDCKPVVSEIKSGTSGRYGTIIRETIARAKDFVSCDLYLKAAP